MLYDEERRLFLAARDRYGIKPLFWTLLDGDEGDKEGGGGERGRERRLLVSAEAKGFLPLGWRPEWDVKALVDAGWGHDTRTVFKGVQKVRDVSSTRSEVLYAKGRVVPTCLSPLLAKRTLVCWPVRFQHALKLFLNASWYL